MRTETEDSESLVRNELLSLPFGKLLDVQESVGKRNFQKTFEMAVLNPLKPRKSDHISVDSSSDDDDDEDDNSESEDEEDDDNKDVKYKKFAKRASKHSPIEITSKRPVSRKREIVHTPKQILGDPRFNPLTGQFNKGLFDQSYSFLNDYKNSEINELKKAVSKEKDPVKRESLNRTLQKMLSKQLAEKTEKRRQNIKKEWRKKQEQEIAEGKKKNPYYLKKSDLKALELVEKFKDLKQSGASLDKFLEKRRKRNATKERTFVPDIRHDGDDRANSGRWRSSRGRGGSKFGGVKKR
ncbi:rRNA biogenesis protein rrp36 [Nowakowskiella sp. JEL0407]|nr:rRNA biogenesis protein rrp36 [Nowakowskiella sp. JEL0407]